MALIAAIDDGPCNQEEVDWKKRRKRGIQIKTVGTLQD